MENLEKCKFELNDGIAKITLAHPMAGNAMDDAFGKELRRIAVFCAMEESVRAVLLCGEGKNFCVGGDLAHVMRQEDRGAAIRDMTIDFHGALQIFAKMDAPLIALVQGAATGAGLALVCVCDYVIASESSFYAYAYTGVGFSSDGGLTWTLPRLVGVRNAQSIIFSGRRVKAPEALQMGIVSEVVADDELDARGNAMAIQIAKGPTRAFGEIKRLLVNGYKNGFEEHLELESMAISKLSRSEDAGNAIQSIFKKEAPVFKNQ